MNDLEPLFKGIKVLEIATYIFGPGSAAILSDFGADVIKIEAPGRGDPLRYAHKAPPFMPLDFSYIWQQDNRNKRSIGLDMKSTEGREILLALVREADVLITNFPPDVLERLKIRYEDLAPENERLIYGQITGFGEKGPEASAPGFDATAYWARSGLMDLVRTASSEPSISGPGMGDHPSAMTMYAAVMTGLYKREKTGRGGKVHSSLLANGLWTASSSLSCILAGGGAAPRPDPAKPTNALLNHYQTRDGRWLLLVILHQKKHWPNLLKAMEREDLLSDPRFLDIKDRNDNAKLLGPVLAETFKTRDLLEWRERLGAQKLTFSVLATMEEVIDDPQVLANDMLIDVEGHDYGRGQAVNSPFWVEGSDKVPARIGPEPGASGADILRELGYSEDNITTLSQKGVI
ncbi:MAG: CoA transferase [Gammaproteobacteria bacterium]|nr:MAG: CoA transferase [Gammaproteobacteria bacterium]